MEIKKGIKIVDLGLYLTKTRTLILSDLHIGYEASLAKQGYLIPSTQFKDIIDSLTKILKKIKPKTIIFNGDTRDNFGRISDEEWRNTLKLIDFLKKHSKNIFLVKGNHDRNLKPLADKRNLQVTN